MKKILFILSLISFYSFNAQSYVFDYRIEIGTTPELVNKTFYFLNSKDRTYKILLFDNLGSLWDSKEKKNRRYYFEYSKKNNESRYESTETLEFVPQDERSISKITVEKVDENKYLIKTFKNKRSKETNLELTVNLKPFEADLIRFYLLDLSYNINTKIIAALKEQLGGNYNYYISDCIVNYRNGVVREFFAEKVESINLKINAPSISK